MYPIKNRKKENKEGNCCLISLNQFWGLVPMYASSLPCRAENKLDFNPTSSLWSIHLILLALHGKVFLQEYIFLTSFFWKEADTQIQPHTMPPQSVATHSNAGLARAVLGGNPHSQKGVLFPPSPPSTAPQHGSQRTITPSFSLPCRNCFPDVRQGIPLTNMLI